MPALARGLHDVKVLDSALCALCGEFPFHSRKRTASHWRSSV